ncbi:hypothetical protein HK096_006894 [Nowakowskiella sp. JEL0078]|nr:hypothetical protein HK096_006894 [Nowakowskiella sp. JEL0078]
MTTKAPKCIECQESDAFYFSTHQKYSKYCSDECQESYEKFITMTDAIKERIQKAGTNAQSHFKEHDIPPPLCKQCHRRGRFYNYSMNCYHPFCGEENCELKTSPLPIRNREIEKNQSTQAPYLQPPEVPSRIKNVGVMVTNADKKLIVLGLAKNSPNTGRYCVFMEEKKVGEQTIDICKRIVKQQISDNIQFKETAGFILANQPSKNITIITIPQKWLELMEFTGIDVNSAMAYLDVTILKLCVLTVTAAGNLQEATQLVFSSPKKSSKNLAIFHTKSFHGHFAHMGDDFFEIFDVNGRNLFVSQMAIQAILFEKKAWIMSFGSPLGGTNSQLRTLGVVSQLLSELGFEQDHEKFAAKLLASNSFTDPLESPISKIPSFTLATEIGDSLQSSVAKEQFLLTFEHLRTQQLRELDPFISILHRIHNDHELASALKVSKNKTPVPGSSNLLNMPSSPRHQSGSGSFAARIAAEQKRTAASSSVDFGSTSGHSKFNQDL